MPFPGFPSRTRYTPVPNPLFGPLLEQIDDLAELKCTLRVIGLLHEKKGFPRVVTRGELEGDRTLARALCGDGGDYPARLHAALTRAVERGTLLHAAVELDGGPTSAYALNTESDRRALVPTPVSAPPPNGLAEEESPAPGLRPNVFALYEENIGLLTPMVADELREAERLYPQQWIEDAVREAVANNRRSWRYVARILERWEREGKGHGEPGRDPSKAGRRRYY